MTRKLCDKGLELNDKDKKLKYLCKKCNLSATKEKYCCKPVRLKKTA